MELTAHGELIIVSLGSLVPMSASELSCTVTAGELRGVDWEDAGLDTIDNSDEFFLFPGQPAHKENTVLFRHQTLRYHTTGKIAVKWKVLGPEWGWFGSSNSCILQLSFAFLSSMFSSPVLKPNLQ